MRIGQYSLKPNGTNEGLKQYSNDNGLARLHNQAEQGHQYDRHAKAG
jgi:hypothetical protein